jgi:carbon starvation protein
VAVTMTAGVEKIFSAMPNVGFLAHAATLAAEAAAPSVTDARVAEVSRLIWNDRIDAALTAFFIAVVIVVLADSARVWTSLTIGSGNGARNAQQAAA